MNFKCGLEILVGYNMVKVSQRHSKASLEEHILSECHDVAICWPRYGNMLTMTSNPFYVKP